VSLTVTDDGGLTDTDTLIVIVENPLAGDNRLRRGRR
jgi:hypothetical protein